MSALDQGKLLRLDGEDQNISFSQFIDVGAPARRLRRIQSELSGADPVVRKELFSRN
jgi:hypothetical protein